MIWEEFWFKTKSGVYKFDAHTLYEEVNKAGFYVMKEADGFAFVQVRGHFIRYVTSTDIASHMFSFMREADKGAFNQLFSQKVLLFRCITSHY